MEERKPGHSLEWVLTYLDITDEKVIERFKKLNQFVNDKNRDEKPIDNTNRPLILYDNTHYRGNSIGKYIPFDNTIFIKEKINIEYDDEFQTQHLLVAHELAHALRGVEPILGDRSGHGVNFFLRMFRDVVWNSNAISLQNKFLGMIKEFSYSCSLGIYKIVERVLRSQSCTIALPLKYFTIGALINDKRYDINDLGRWFINIIKDHYSDISNDEMLNLDLESIFERIINNKPKVDKINSLGKLKSH